MLKNYISDIQRQVESKLVTIVWFADSDSCGWLYVVEELLSCNSTDGTELFKVINETMVTDGVWNIIYNIQMQTEYTALSIRKFFFFHFCSQLRVFLRGRVWKEISLIAYFCWWLCVDLGGFIWNFCMIITLKYPIIPIPVFGM